MKTELVKNFCKSASFKLLVFGSIVNVLLLLNHVDPYLCAGRQSLVLLGSLVHYRYSQKIQNLLYISHEVEEIGVVLEQKYSFLKIEPLLVIWVVFATIVQLYISCFSQPWAEVLYLICCPSFVIYCVFMASKITVLLFGKDARELFFPSSSSKNPKLTVRRFSTSSKVLYFCKVCVQGSVAAGLGIWAIPKLVHGDWDYRGVWLNKIAYPFTGYKSDSEWLCRQANRLCLYDHNVVPRITGEDGYLSPSLVDEEYKRMKIDRPNS